MRVNLPMSKLVNAFAVYFHQSTKGPNFSFTNVLPLNNTGVSHLTNLQRDLISLFSELLKMELYIGYGGSVLKEMLQVQSRRGAAILTPKAVNFDFISDIKGKEGRLVLVKDKLDNEVTLLMCASPGTNKSFFKKCSDSHGNAGN